MPKMIETSETYEPLLEEPMFGNEGFMSLRRDAENYPEYWDDGYVPSRDGRERLAPVRRVVIEPTVSPEPARIGGAVPERLERTEAPPPFREKSVAPAPSGSGLKLKAGERVIKKWPRPVWFLRMSDTKNVIGHDVHLTKLKSGNYAFRGVDDETFENLYRIVGKRSPSESDAFGPFKIKGKGKRIRGSRI